MAKPSAYKPTRRFTGMQPPAIVGQLDNVLETKELSQENNKHKMEKNNMETIMEDVQVQPWWQDEDDITMFSETAVKEAMNKELSQRPSNNGTKDIKCRFCGKGFSQFIHDTDTQTFAATPSSKAMRLLLTIAIIKQFTVFTTNVANAFLNTPIDEEVIAQPPKEY
eukprot:6490955-Amphidinium_carterae.1